MDPYLESPAFWRSLHQLFVASLTRELNQALPEGFAATVDERLYVTWSDRSIFPDLVVSRQANASTPEPLILGATALADPPLRLTVQPERMREPFIEIRTTHGDREVVALIELLSPANKAADSEGRAEYLRKQHEALGSDAHLLEIDLLRTGRHTVSIHEAVLQRRAGHRDYVICLHRAHGFGQFDVWPFTVRERFPRVEVPLTEEILPVVLDLQTAFDRCYDDGPFRRLVDYDEEPEVPLSGIDAVWADSLLREKGLRS